MGEPNEPLGTAVSIHRWARGNAPSAQDIEDLDVLLRELAAPDDPEPNLTRENFVEHMRFTNAMLIIARDLTTGRIIGMASLHEKHLLGIGLTGDVEEFVVKEEYRGRGIAEAMENALRLSARESARERGINLFLTSARWRIAANKFYQRHGWTRYATNNYWKILD
ncbi:MAG: GNAT family N-acetyltransferase [Parcubacteria group bacterium]|nr:GNAT family N-acetyltransferase [Parcubacteria group bacterium]